MPSLYSMVFKCIQAGRPRKRCRKLVADNGYDAESFRQYCDRYRMQPVIPYRVMKRKPKPGLARLFDKPKYRERNVIERLFGWLKEHRRLATRYCKLATSYAAMVTLACCRRVFTTPHFVHSLESRQHGVGDGQDVSSLPQTGEKMAYCLPV